MIWFKKIISLLFPERCALCKNISYSVICKECISLFAKVPLCKCLKCGVISVLYECPCLLPDRYYFSRIASYGYYEDGIKDIIAAYKYEKKKDLAKPLGIILALYLNDELLWSNIDCIVPVPIYGDVLQKRGFNQALLLAEVIGNELEISVQSNILAKICCTKDQSTLSREERIKNVKGAFRAGSECKGKNILLIDDVFTTGATANEASRALKESGALSISVLTLAKTIFNPSGKNNITREPGI